MVARSARVDLPDALAQVLSGDPLALPLITPIALAELREAASALGSPLVVTRAATVAVLKGLNEATYSPEQVQGWASFVRRGYVASQAEGSIRPLDIDYDETWEESIAAAISRLDEIGDVIDGEVTQGEMLDLLRMLGEP
jgi:hypothetical protein